MFKRKDFDDELSKLTELSDEIKRIENQAKAKRDERDKLALKILATGKYSLRSIAKKAGISNVRLIQIRDKNAKSV